MNLLTLNKKITERRRRAFWLAIILFNCCAQSLWTIQSALTAYISPVFYFAVNVLGLGLCLRKEVYERNRVYLLGLYFIAWYAVCWLVHRDISSFQVNELISLATLLSSWGLALPFGTVTDDFDKKRALNSILSILTLALAVAVWAALIPTFRRTSFTLPGGDKAFGIVRARESGWKENYIYTYPVMFGMHCYSTAYLSLLGFFMALYLFVQKKMRPLMLFGMIGFVLAISLTKCRLALLSFGLGLFTLGLFLFRHKNRDASPGKTVLAGAVIALAVALCLMLLWRLGTRAGELILVKSENDHIKRAFSERLPNGNGRVALWKHIPDMMKEYAPTSYLFGIHGDVLYTFLYNTLHSSHIHSGFFSALLLMGVPGFLLALVFTVIIVRNTVTIFLKMKKHSVGVSDLLLLPIPVCFLLAAFGEPLLFVGYIFKVIALVFYLVSGYVLELADRIRKEEAG